MDFFENIDALLWRLAAILALVLVATGSRSCGYSRH